MELHLTRKQFGPKATLGELAVDGELFCVTLEDPVREIAPDGTGKIYGDTAIPAGRYQVRITWSNKFQKPMLAVQDVPHFTGIRIHSGNTDADTMGCILVGNVIDGPDRIHGGTETLPVLVYRVKQELSAGNDVWLEVA